MKLRTRKLFPAACSLLALMPSVQLGAQVPVTADHGQASPRTITVAGHAEVSAVPDTATVRLGVSRQGPQLAALRDEVGAAVDAFLALTDSLGIARRAVNSTGVNVRPNYRYDRESGERSITGYEVSRQLIVELTDLERLGALIEGSIEAGVNQASAPEFGVSDRPERYRQTLELAARNARAKAQRLAESLGARVGRVHRIDEGGGDGVRPPPVPMRMMAEQDSGGGYETGSMNIRADITVVFVLQD